MHINKTSLVFPSVQWLTDERTVGKAVFLCPLSSVLDMKQDTLRRSTSTSFGIPGGIFIKISQLNSLTAANIVSVEKEIAQILFS